MLTKADDYPIHQRPEPIAYAGSDKNFFDRYFFNGYDGAGENYFAVAFGVYPNTNLADASFSVIHDGVQHSIHASRVLNMERMDIQVGPISIDIIAPLVRLRVRVTENEYGIAADLTFDARVKVIEEPRFTYRIGPRTMMDYTRLTQNGSYTGWIEVKGHRIDVTQGGFLGTRDRSWGVRMIGPTDMQPVAPPPFPQFYFLWAPLNFDDCATFYAENAYGDGTSWAKGATLSPLGEEEPQHALESKIAVIFRSGTRHAKSALIQFSLADGREIVINLETQYQFYQSGIGYMNPEWGHGMYKGENAIGYEEYALSAIDESDLRFLHVQAFVKAGMEDDTGTQRQGIGILEQLILGPHEPSGFKELFDLAP